MFLVSNNKYIYKVKNTQSKKLCNQLFNNIGNIFEITHGPDQVVFNFSSYREVAFA